MAKEEKTKPNVKALIAFRLDGKHIAPGTVVAKSAFQNKSDWTNLCNMTPPRAEETSDAVGEAKKAKGKAEKEAVPGL